MWNQKWKRRNIVFRNNSKKHKIYPVLVNHFYKNRNTCYHRFPRVCSKSFFFDKILWKGQSDEMFCFIFEPLKFNLSFFRTHLWFSFTFLFLSSRRIYWYKFSAFFYEKIYKSYRFYRNPLHRFLHELYIKINILDLSGFSEPSMPSLSFWKPIYLF